MKVSAFDRLIDQYLKDKLKPEEKRKVEVWLNDLSQLEAFNNLSRAEQQAIEKRIYNGLSKKIKAAEKQKKSAVIFQLKPLLKIASCFVLAALLVFTFRVKLKEIFNIQQYASVSNTSGHITKTILADGTIVWLKGNSKLNFPIKFKDSLRVVKLTGEALFEVAKDAAHPFIIHSGALTTRVLGTSFNIKQSQAQTEVTVLTGHVFLSSKNVVAVSLLPYQKAVFSDHKKTLLKEARPALQVTALTAGTEYNMLFNDVVLAEVIRRIEKKFEVKIKLEPELSKQLITADLTDQSLINTLDLITEALNLNYQFEGQSILLKRKHKL